MTPFQLDSHGKEGCESLISTAGVFGLTRLLKPLVPLASDDPTDAVSPSVTRDSCVGCLRIPVQVDGRLDSSNLGGACMLVDPPRNESEERVLSDCTSRGVG